MRKILLALLFLLISVPIMVFAEPANEGMRTWGAEDPNQNQADLPNDPTVGNPILAGDGYLTTNDLMIRFPEERLKYVEKELGYPVAFNDYYPSQYSLEVDLGWLQSPLSIIHKFTNAVWQNILMFDFGVIMFVENAYSLDLVDSLAKQIEKVVQNISGFSSNGLGDQGLWGELGVVLISLAGAWAAYMFMVKRAATRATAGLIWTIVVMVLAFAYFANTAKVMRYVNDLSSDLSSQVLTIGMDLTPSQPLTLEEEVKDLKGIKDPPREYPKEAASFVIADRLYQLLIYEPYLMLQYGKTSKDIDKARADAILKHRLGSKAREQAVKKEVKENKIYMMTEEGVFERLAAVILLWITHVTFGVCVLVVSGVILVYQMVFVILSLFAPFALLLALMPAWNFVAINWFKRWIGALAMKLVVSIFLSVLLAVSQVLYEAARPEEYGYVMTIVLQLILIIGVIWQRKNLTSILKAPMQALDQSIPGEAPGSIRQGARRVVQTAYRIKRLDNFKGKKSRFPSSPAGSRKRRKPANQSQNQGGLSVAMRSSQSSSPSPKTTK